MGSFAEIAGHCRVRVTRTVAAGAPHGQPGLGVRCLCPGEEFQLWSTHRSSLGGYLATVAEESHDPYLGMYATPLSRMWILPLDCLETIKENT